MLKNITPLILTYNEAPNIGRTLERLTWAQDIVVIDSYSDNETLNIIKNYPNIRIYQRKFDHFANQCNYGLESADIQTEWVLSLDADYILTKEFIEEIDKLNPNIDTKGYKADFIYCVYDQKLKGCTYPPVTVLFKKEAAYYRQDGHAHRVVVDGNVEKLSAPILHDDRKPLTRWIISQDKYMKIERNKLLGSSWSDLGWSDRIRRMRFIAPFLMLIYCLFVKGVILNGKAGVLYAFQRTLAEMLLSVYLLDNDVKKRFPDQNGK